MPPADPVGDICYNTITHTIVPGADLQICTSYGYYENYTMMGQTVTGCYNMITHQLSNLSREVCEAYTWVPAVDIPTTAGATTLHTALVAALTQAELVSTLQGEGPFTVFAPTDQAFADAGIDLAALDNADGKATLTDILTYHVYSGAVQSSAVTDGMTVTMLNGDDATFTVTDGTVKIGDATVTLADVPTSNGVIHVIDKVLIPPMDEPTLPVGCDYLIGIDDTGFAYDNIELSINKGETVCWIWSDETMAHNVAQIANEGDTTRMIGGAYSGEAMTSVDYRLTFTDDQTFLYMCEPHATMDMAGKIIVGTGIEQVQDSPADNYGDDDENNTPGFTVIILGIAALAAVMVSRRQ